MPGTMEQSALRVEGSDDLHTIKHLLARHGVDYESKPLPPKFPEIINLKGITNLLRGMKEAVSASTGRAAGFVLDADSPLQSRWNAVKQRLKSVDVETPRRPSANGFIGESGQYKSRVGVWLMPDNQHDGKIEDFLQTLIDEDYPLIGHAESSTDTARELGATFSASDDGKAIVYAWLAWQEDPGRPYGTAIRAKYFRHDSPAANAFVTWLKLLYGVT